jgi:hypothetical protein
VNSHLLVFVRSEPKERPAEAEPVHAIQSSKPQLESKKAKIIPYPSHFMHASPPPIMRKASENPNNNHCTRRGKLEVSADKWKEKKIA